MMNSLLPGLEVGPDNARYSIIWLHGLGADGNDFEPIVAELNFPERDQVRFIFPHAPHRPVTINGGYVMRAWYDIYSTQINSKEDADGVRTSAHQLEALIEREVSRGVRTENIILAGFSQGGAIALHTGLRYPKPLAGLLVLSAYLPLADSFNATHHPANKSTPIFMAHGQRDPVIPIEIAESSRKQLQAQHYNIEWRTYPMEHSVVPDEIDDISSWFDRVLATPK